MKGESQIDAIMWFRRDIRLDDNHALFKVLSEKNNVLALFIFDERILERLPQDDARVTFLFDSVEGLAKNLRKNGSDLLVRHGKVEMVIEEILMQYGDVDIYANEDYEPYARTRDANVKSIVQSHGAVFRTHKDHVLYAPGEILKADHTPYTVYTPYSKKVLASIEEDMVCAEYEITEKLLSSFCSIDNAPELVSLEDLGFERSAVTVSAFHVTADFLEGYRNSREFPYMFDGTSHAGPYLRFGLVSVRALARQALQSVDRTFLKELLWRDFFQMILYFYPQTPLTAFKVKYDAIAWRTDDVSLNDFDAWCAGETGYPLVDAGMRELNATGTMHNRVRMVAASFLCKHLLIDWRKGERYFALKLLDYEIASNVGNWQWASGGGCDAAPYFRIFNPTTQHEKFDPDSLYVRKWIPEYDTEHYVNQIVPHKEARERALATYKNSLQQYEKSNST